jgi:DNA-binding CsgD family transcriptional regulator
MFGKITELIESYYHDGQFMDRDYKYRFIAKMSMPAKKTGCIHYLGGFSKNGYGVFEINNKSHSAHRISYELFVGLIPKNKLVLHKCDNRQCIAPQHLFVGTQADNIKDMQNKGRNSCGIGERHGMAKLTALQVKDIKMYIKRGKKQKEIAEIYNVSVATINDIKNKRSWK